MEAVEMPFKAEGRAYALLATPRGDDWTMQLVTKRDAETNIIWTKELDNPQAQLVWMLVQINQPQEHKDYRNSTIYYRTPEEQRQATAILQQIVEGHIESLAMRDALGGIYGWG